MIAKHSSQAAPLDAGLIALTGRFVSEVPRYCPDRRPAWLMPASRTAILGGPHPDAPVEGILIVALGHRRPWRGV
ncbi:MAG: hypothetical protein AB7F22_30580 [Reyranella sp.]|uniref:hypothetical protein n=1 Tax=Reyranella sp. TaxID=1929291 RepID=UPI003D1201F5